MTGSLQEIRLTLLQPTSETWYANTPHFWTSRIDSRTVTNSCHRVLLLTSITENQLLPIRLFRELVSSQQQKLVKREPQSKIKEYADKFAVDSLILVPMNKNVVSPSSQLPSPSTLLCQTKKISKKFHKRLTVMIS